MRRRPPSPLVLAALLLPPLLLAHALAPGAAGAQGGPDAAAAAPAPLPSVTLPPELDRVLRDYERAWMGRDPAGLAALFAEDGFVLANNRPPVRGREAIRAAYANAGGGLSLRALAYATSDTVGYIIGAYASGAGVPDAGKFILALRRPRGRGAWQIAADIDNPSQQQRRAPGPPPG